MESKLQTTVELPPILRLPSEIRLKIYRLLLLSDSTVRMQWPRCGRYSTPPNCLLPAILSTCHFIYGEAMDVLYRENVFRAHRVNDSNNNAALITRAIFVIETRSRKFAGSDASELPNFLGTHPNLKLLRLDFKNGLLKDMLTRDILSYALYTSSELSVLSNFLYLETPFMEAQLVQAIKMVIFMRKNFPECFAKIDGIQEQRRDRGRPQEKLFEANRK